MKPYERPTLLSQISFLFELFHPKACILQVGQRASPCACVFDHGRTENRWRRRLLVGHDVSIRLANTRQPVRGLLLLLRCCNCRFSENFD